MVHKTGNAYLALGIDQAHEQNNAVIKGNGGAVGLTENPSSLRRFTVGGPELARLLREFEGDDDSEGESHHEQTPFFQKRFIDTCAALKEVFLSYENPFTNTTDELITLDTREVASPEAVNNLYNLEETGTAMYKAYVKDRLESHQKSIFDPISKVESRIFTLPLKQKKTTVQSTMAADVKLFSTLYIVSTCRKLELNKFFMHENLPFPPSVAQPDGSLKQGNKSVLVPLLEGLIPKNL